MRLRHFPKNVAKMITLSAAALGISVAVSLLVTDNTVFVATEAGTTQASESHREEQVVRRIFSPPARAGRPSWQWRERVRAVVQKIASAHEYRLYQALYDRAEYPDPDARSLFFLKAPASKQPPPHGLLVLTPEDYVAWSVLETPGFEAAIEQRLFGRWAIIYGQEDDSLAAFSRHVLNLASILYAQPWGAQAECAPLPLPVGGAPLVVECGDVRISLYRPLLNRLLQQAALERDRDIAELMEKLDPQLSFYLRGVQ